ncbi:transposase [Mycobacterium kubicae]|nr:transposase [Mycobacterium kubicae]QNI12635.1 transposase [Mycobacterium kubicae]QNI12793.1 transposase [Mycobacterium kubicae]
MSTSGFHEWRTRAACDRDRHDAELANTITAIHTASRHTYGVRRI